MGFWGGIGISWTIDKQSAPCSRQITTPTVQHLITQFLQAGCSSWRPTNSVKAPKAQKMSVKPDLQTLPTFQTWFFFYDSKVCFTFGFVDDVMFFGTNVASRRRAFTCTDCGKTFMRIDRLRSHALVYSGIKNLKCPQCA